MLWSDPADVEMRSPRASWALSIEGSLRRWSRTATMDYTLALTPACPP